MIIVLPIKIVAMFTLFTKIDNIFNPMRLMKAERTRKLNERRYF